MDLGTLLALPVLASARPAVLYGEHLLDRDVRWVHTSEIYDIAPLLRGHEVLLTTGLGLVGSSEERLREYVAELSSRSVSALVLELGRTFPDMPPALLAEAQRRDLALVALHGVVPFIEVTQVVHELLIAQEAAALRRSEHIQSELTRCLVSGRGLRPLLRRISELAGCAAALVSGDGNLVASSDDSEACPVPASHPSRAVEVFGVEWGSLVLRGEPGVLLDSVLSRGAEALAIELVRTAGVAPARAEAGAELLRDLAQQRFATTAELSTRAAGVGLIPRATELIVCCCLRVDGQGGGSHRVLNAAREASRRTLRSPVVAEEGDEILVAGLSTQAAESRALRGLLEQLADIVERELRATGGTPPLLIASGAAVDEVPALVGSFARAREAITLAHHLGMRRRILVPADLGVERLLSRLVGDPELERFVHEQLGALLDHDARHGRELLPTLEAYLAHGLSKTRCAEALQVRRQTLYARLERIESLLGDIRLGDREHRTALDLALVAWRLRTSAAPHSPA